MASVRLSKNADEKSTFAIDVELLDENDDPAVPNNDLVFRLTDENGVVINDLEDVELDSDSSVTIVLTGDDLLIGEFGIHRALTLTCTYNSSLGTNLHYQKTLVFDIDPSPGVT